MSALPFLALMRHPLLDNPLVRHTSWDNLQNVFRATLLLDFLFSGSKLGNKELLVPTPTTNNGIDMDPTPTRTVVVTADTKLLAFFCWALCIGFALGFTVCWVLRVTSIHTLDENKYDDVMPANSESLRTVTEETLETKVIQQSTIQVQTRSYPVIKRRQAHVGLYKRFQRLRPLKSQVKIGSTDSPQWQPVTQLITWYLPSPADERSVPTVLSAAAVEGASEDPIEDIIKDSGLGFYISSVDMLRLDAFFHQEYSDYIIAWRFVTVMADSESAILVLRMLFSVEGADAENPPQDIAVLLPLEASNHPDACFKLWLGDHFVGITRPDVAHWSDCFPQWRDMEPSQYQWDWELDSDSHEANATAQSTLCAEVEHDFEDLDNTFGLGMPAMDFKDLDDAFGLGTPMATTMSAAAVVHGTTAAKYDAGLDDNDWNEDAMARFIATLNVPKWATTPIPTVIPVDLVTMAARPTPCTALVRRGRGACQSRTTTPTLTIPEWATTSFTTAMLPVFLVKMMALSTTCTAMAFAVSPQVGHELYSDGDTTCGFEYDDTSHNLYGIAMVATHPKACMVLVPRGRGRDTGTTPMLRPTLWWHVVRLVWQCCSGGGYSGGGCSGGGCSGGIIGDGDDTPYDLYGVGSIPTTIPPAILVKMMARPTTGMAMHDDGTPYGSYDVGAPRHL
ncbi:predicted protein [Postia placenta Mad-698-R]|nr:predicted protein [Postia placenta Mad-698-R]